jgi:hypothetical protein
MQADQAKVTHDRRLTIDDDSTVTPGCICGWAGTPLPPADEANPAACIFTASGTVSRAQLVRAASQHDAHLAAVRVEKSAAPRA